MNMLKKIAMALYALAAVLIAALIIGFLRIIELSGGWEEALQEEPMVWTLVGLLIGILVVVFSFRLYRKNCERKWLRITKNTFSILLLLIALVVGTVGVFLAADEIEREEKRQRREEVVQSVIDDFNSDDGDLVDEMIWTAHFQGFGKVTQVRDSTLSYWGSHLQSIRDSYKAAVVRRSEAGSPRAEFVRGEEYSGFDVSSNYRQCVTDEDAEHAFYWWSQAASHGLTNAYIRMAQCYEGTFNVPTLYTNRQIAFDWWRKAGEAGWSYGYYSMGLMLAEDDSIEEAKQYWEIAKSMGGMESSEYYKIGRMLAEHNCIEEAKQYWKIAADMGNEDAKNALEKVYSDDVQPGAKKNNPPL